MTFKKFFYFTFAIFCMNCIFAQESLKSSEEEYYDFLSLQGFIARPTLGYRTLSDSVWTLDDETEHLWKDNNLGTTFTLWQKQNQSQNWFIKGLNQNIKLRVYGPDWYNSYNTAAPYGQNDGALWQGKGYNTSLSAGARLEAYGFELTIKPQVTFSQNLEFEIMPSSYDSEYGYFWGYAKNIGIDAPQRFGDKAFWTFDWGDSEIRWSWHTFTLGFGTQSAWLGPMYLNPMLGSNNAATYPKLDFGFRKTSLYMPYFGWYLGDFEMRTWAGYLSESEYFDDNDSNDHNLLVGLNFTYAPPFIPNLTVGFNRIYLTKFKLSNLYYWTYLFQLNNVNNWQEDDDGEDQKVALYAHWFFEKVGFEVYGEYGFDDFSSDKKANPFHTGIYSVGAKQNIPLPHKKLQSQIIFEWNNFEMSQDFQLQWQYGGFYNHSKITQGYTQNGQIIGAGSGQMGNSQYLEYKLYYPKGSSSIYFHRYCPDINYIYNKAVNADASTTATTNTIGEDYYANYETYFVFGANSQYFVLPNLSLQANLAYIYIWNKNYVRYSALKSFQFGLEVKYTF